MTSQDVENYKQIKSDLDQLRSIVEKSELWVYKRQGSDEGIDAAETLSAEPDHKLVLYIVYCKMLLTVGSSRLCILCPGLQRGQGFVLPKFIHSADTDSLITTKSSLHITSNV